MQKFWENLQYVVLFLLIVGQATVGSWFVRGQCVYLSANVISITRSFALGRPMADKIKEVAMFGLTVALLLIKYFGIKS